MLNKLLVLLLYCFLFSHTYAKVGVEKVSKTSIQNLFKGLNSFRFEAEVYKDSINNKLFNAFDQYLYYVDVDFTFLDSINNLKKIRCDDKLVLYSWCFNDDFGYAHHNAVIQIKKDGNTINVVPLRDSTIENPIKNPEYKIITDEKWLGALYYDIRKLSENKYVLIGWRGADNVLNQKVIEILNIDNGNISFGSKVFIGNKYSRQRRIIFKYSIRTSMVLKFEPPNLIRFDYLDPIKPNLKEIYEYYGPVVNRIDGFEIKSGKLYYQPAVEAKNKKDKKDKLYNNPKQNDKFNKSK